MSFVVEICRHPHNAVRLLEQTRRYQRQFQVSYLAQFRRLLRLYVKDNYMSCEIATLGLADPRIPLPELQQFISKHALLKIQYSLNDAHYLSLTEDKIVFHALCDSFLIPSPRLYAVFSPQEGWLNDGTIIKGQAQWVDYLERHAPREIVIKPSLGFYARGFKMLERREHRWLCKTGRSYNSRELYQSLAEDPNFDRFILQERVTNHDDLNRLSHSDALQTTRIVTLTDSEHNPKVINALFKIVRGENTSDNFDGGETGNLLANLDIKTGKILAVVGKQNGSLQSITHDEQTGKSYCEFTMPFWAEAKELALQAATKFSPIKTIGWDIAITEKGPVVIEGNQCWDPGQNYFKEGQILRSQLSEATSS